MSEPFFTLHVRSLLDGTFDNDPAILRHLRQELKRQLKKMGQWNLPPKHLGFEGEAWEVSDALDDLVQETYIACIQKRLTKLAEHIELTGSCEGSIRRKITWFLQERQRSGNPISRRIFQNVRIASGWLVDKGKAHTTQNGTFVAKTIVLALGKKMHDSAEELRNILSIHLGDREFLKNVSRRSLGTWEMLESVLGGRLRDNLSGYEIGELSNVISENCRKPEVINDVGEDGEAGFDSIWGSISEIRTDVRQSRYSLVCELEKSENLDEMIRSYSQLASSVIKSERIRDRVFIVLTKLVELVRQGEDIRRLSLRKLAKLLGVSKSTLGEDMERLKSCFSSLGHQRKEIES